MSRYSERLEDAGLTPEEAAAAAVPESGPGLTTTGGNRYATALDYLHATHPETGIEVVFVPGEALPDWAVATQAAKERQTLAKLPGLPPQSEPKGERPVKGR
ncbi:hypothetical protein [Arthrobacter sp. H16F315]|uniref:hypothetical protein n=1 Tax=Arthrobacter sp. H16F315 TaxID=2955314 RepID=UPI0020968B4E|nr:hypothetical protein [Arthrobacter sp. H16F315]MDD1477068.1 hypothetical protein [Arthrobacter sp. H16F315]